MHPWPHESRDRDIVGRGGRRALLDSGSGGKRRGCAYGYLFILLAGGARTSVESEDATKKTGE